MWARLFSSDLHFYKSPIPISLEQHQHALCPAHANDRPKLARSLIVRMSAHTLFFKLECPSSVMMCEGPLSGMLPSPWQKSNPTLPGSLPLPMHGLTLCGFERSTRTANVPPLQVQSKTLSSCCVDYLPLCGKRSRDHDKTDDSDSTVPSSPRPAVRSKSKNSDSASDVETENKKSANVPQSNLPVDNSNRIVKLQKENAELQKKIQESDEELKKLREIVGQFLDVEKTQKRPAVKEESKPQRRYWNHDEHERFLQALQRHGPKDVKAIANFVGTRNPTQVRTHAQKYFQKLARTGGSSFPGESCSGEENCSSPGSPSEHHM